MSTYGNAGEVQALVRHLPFDSQGYPTTEDVERWLTEASAKLSGWLRAAGYTEAIADEDALTVLNSYANAYAAGMAEKSQAPSYTSEKDDTERSDRWFAQWNEARAWITSGALGSLPETPTEPVMPVSTAVRTQATW